ncbi:hypothetical protein [Mycobacterium sp. 852002-10029_SCH5224772]|uniref:hypothetical protein n=1 Tax=Mycobacterium sp. 852002-10029_SCH5224772 TaxID=1834083 RepID=UPI0012E6FB32|nr:hypothetical protein [Mycobacterium sp. 852002-10029_SCH5224772]
MPQGWYDDCIALGEFQSDSAFHVKQLDRYWHEARPLAYGAAGSHVLPIAIKKLPPSAQLIEISSYRKRILPTPEGVEAPSYPTMRELSLRAITSQPELTVFTPRVGREFLVAQPKYFKKSIIGQYAACHHRQDILDYASLAVEMGVLDSDSASEFLASRHFIPGGVELGIYPVDWLTKALSSIESISRQFLNRYHNRVEKYDTYQVRAVGFLSERLGSFLLIRQLTEFYSNKIPAEIFGYMSVIVDDNSGYSIASTEPQGGRLSRYRSKRKQAR